MRRPGGFTLVELLVTLAVVGVLLSFVYQIFISQQRSFSIQEEVADAQQNARVALEELTHALTSLGAGVAGEEGQVRLLVAHPYQLTFNADRSTDHAALAPGSAVPGAEPADGYQVIPGAYAASPAETYRYFLKPDGPHHTLTREVNGSAGAQVALHLANLRLGEPLFMYYGDFDGDGTFETLDRVDTATSPRVAAGEPLDTVVRRIELHVITQTDHPDPRFPDHGGYRLTRLTSSVSPRNLWDCPVVSLLPATVPDQDPAAPGHQLHRSAALLGSTLDIGFRVTRGGAAEAGRRVEFSLAGPSAATVTGAGTTDADGRVDAAITWPAACGAFPTGVHTLTARTAEPPTLSTPFGLCAPHTATVDLEVIPGLPASVSFDGVAVAPGAPHTAGAAHTLDVPGCGGTVDVTYEVLDYCAQRVRPQDALAHPVDLEVTDGGGQPAAGFGDLAPPRLTAESGVLTYRSYDGGPYSAYSSVQRVNVAPHPYLAAVRPAALPGEVVVRVHPVPHRLAGLTPHIAAASFSDCPDPSLGVADTFGIEDACGNPLTTLLGNPFGDFYVAAALVSPPPPVPVLGTLASEGNPSPFPDAVDIRRDDGLGQVSAGTPGAWVSGGSFEIRYAPPVCGLGDLAYRPTVTLTPSWDPAGALPALPVHLSPCTSCAVRVLDGDGNPVTTLRRDCEPEYTVEVTHCEPLGTTVELVVEPFGGGGSASFSPAALQTTAVLPFAAGAPPGAPQTARARLYVNHAGTGSSFRIAAHLPDAAAAGTLGAVTCRSDAVSVDTSCDHLLISPVPDNPGPVPANPRAQDTPLCAAEGSEVFFRVKDCDQNAREGAADDIQNTAGTHRGLQVEVVDADGTVLDRESPDLFESDVHGTRAFDSPYFQGSLPVTRDPDDGAFSGRLRAPVDRVVTVRARYADPDDPWDDRCAAEALLVPPLPVCFPFPAQSWGDWEGELRVHGGDAAVAGDLLLPAAPLLVAKDPAAAPSSAAYGPVPRDPFFNAYVGGTISVDGAPLLSPGETDQPFAPGGAGDTVSISHPNYFQRVPDAAGLLSRLDYDRLRLLAKARGVYWEAVPGPAGSWLVANPARPQLGAISFAEATRLGGLGAHDGAFAFVDAPAGLQGAGRVDQADLGDLPIFTVTGEYFTRGLLYVAGSVMFDAAAGAREVEAEAAAPGDARYDEAAGGFARADLPLDFAAAPGPTALGPLAVNLAGALYADGEIRLPGGPRIYGAIAAERGVRQAGTAELWYDPRWMESRLELCSHCCGLSLSPAAPELALGDMLLLAAQRPVGRVVWESLAPQVAAVDDLGLVTSRAEGLAVVRAVDESGCVAEAEVRVFCGLALEAPGGTDLEPGARATVVATGHQGGPSWSIDHPAALTLIQNFGPTVEVEAGAIGGAQVTALDGAGCSASLDFTVNCPPGRLLQAQPAVPGPGETVALSVREGGLDVTARYTFSAGGAPLPGSTLTVPGLAPLDVAATLAGGQCPLGPLTVTPACPPYALSAAPIPARVGQPVELAVRDAASTDMTGAFSFAASPPGSASILGATLLPLAPGSLSVTGTDAFGCPAGPVSFPVEP
ncbi:MAG: prepilin-type N-terminal cleavage/methylation domain-containing protein [Thermodesulfobacteriota bacterium]